MIVQPVDAVPPPCHAGLESDLVRRALERLALSAGLLQTVGEEVGTSLRSEDGGATFEGGINLFDDHWIAFDLRSFLLSDLGEGSGERSSLAAFLRRVAGEVEAGGGAAAAGPLPALLAA